MKQLYVVRATFSAHFGGSMWIFFDRDTAKAKRNTLKKLDKYCNVSMTVVAVGKRTYN